MSAREKLPPMVAMSEAIRGVIEKSSGVTRLGDIPDDHLAAYAEIVTAFGVDLRAELERRHPAVRLSWTQPLCRDCWDARNPERLVPRDQPERAEEETCCDCGERTRSGIYLRIDPATVRYPTVKE